MVVKGHPITIALPGVSLDCAAAASSVAIPNTTAGTKAKWVLVVANNNDNSFQFILTGGTAVSASTGIRGRSGGPGMLFNVAAFDLISFRNASGGATATDGLRIYPLEDH